MILNREKQILLVAVALMAVFVSCIDVPANSPPLPDYRSLVKYFNAGSGRDTISHVISSVAWTKKDTSKIYTLSGTDSVYTVTIITSSYIIDRYRRYDVNFAQTYNVYVDGSLRATIPIGAASNYFDTPSGGRKLELGGTGTAVDSIRITKIDSVVSIKRDTIRNGIVVGKSKFDTTKSYYSLIKITVPAVATPLTIDSTLISFETERQRSVFFVGTNDYVIFKEQGQVRFGKIKYLSAAERNLFEPQGFVDTALVRFVNADTTSGSTVMKTNNVTVATVAFSASSGNLKFRAKTDTTSDATYKFIFTSGVINDTVTAILSPRKQYSFIRINDAGVVKIKTFVH